MIRLLALHAGSRARQGLEDLVIAIQGVRDEDGTFLLYPQTVFECKRKP